MISLYSCAMVKLKAKRKQQIVTILDPRVKPEDDAWADKASSYLSAYSNPIGY